MISPNAATRLNNFRGQKKQLLGNQAGQVPPAWRNTNSASGSGAKGKHVQQGSKILLSQLPPDVLEKEVEELFRKTVGPLSECFLIYNSQGRSKGMAVVVFQRPGDAVVARAKYNGKVVDARKPLRIEIIVDSESASPAAPPSLLSRLEPKPLAANNHVNNVPLIPASSSPMKAASNPANLAATPARRVRYKKGPRRLNKRQAPPGVIKTAPVTRDQLDKEMDDYRAATDTLSVS